MACVKPLLMLTMLLLSWLVILPGVTVGATSRGLVSVTFVELVDGSGYVIGKLPGYMARSGTCYSYSGVHWGWDKIPVRYSVNTAGGPSGAAAAVKAGFEVWNTAGTSFRFVKNGGNPVSWGPIDGPGGYVAYARWWYDLATLEISSADVVFDSSEAWATDGSPEAFDVRSLAAHESGHWLSLNDLYSSSCSEETMYGYSVPGETKKRTLGPGDIAGIQAIYGQAESTITVTVIDSTSGKVLSGAYVFLDGDRKGTTDRLGQVKITHVTQGRHMITVSKTGYHPTQLAHILGNQSPSGLTVAMQPQLSPR